MMKMRQQPDSSYMNKLNKQKALFLHNNRGGQITYKHEETAAAGLINMMRGNNYGVDYERDESPVSVISHSASVISQPSSACTSMEHHLLLSPPLINPNPAINQSFADPHYAYKPEQFSVGTSAASTSEDDSSAYNLPTLFFEVAPLQEEISNAQPVSTKKDNFKNSSGDEELDTQQSSAKPIKRKSLIDSETTNSVEGSLRSDDDDEHMISIDLQGWQENSSLLREKNIKGSEKELSKEAEEEKQAGDISIATLEQNDERKRDQKLERSTSHGQAALVAEPTKSHNTGERATSHVGRYEAEALKGPQPAQRNVNLFIQKASPSFMAIRQKSINSTKSSKWDDAEKWLCYDNHVSHHHKVKNSSLSAQKWDSDNDATSDRGVLSVSKASNKHKDNHASLNRRNLGVSKVYEHHGSKEDVACASGAHHLLMMQNTDVTPSRGSLSIDIMPRSKHTCTSQSANTNGFLKNKMLERDNAKRNRFEANSGTCRKSDFGYMSCGEVVHPHVLGNKLAAITASDGETYTNNASNYQPCHASQTSMSSGSVSGEDFKTKDHNFKATFARWKKDNSDESVAYAHSVRECDYLSSGELLSQANRHRNLAAISTSDGEMYANYASYQQHKNNVSYTQRLKHHQLLQKLRRKCSPSNGGHKGIAQHVREDGAQNFVGKNGYGVVSVHAASRLSIPMQASSSKDQFWTQGEYGRTQSVGKQENKVARDESACITTTGMQMEFVVQTPTHGRSASMKDACTEVSPTVSRRDMGTQMTPSESSPITSKCTSPMQNTSPARHNTPTRTSPPLNPQINHINVDAKDDIDISDIEDKINSSARKPSHGNAMELESCHWAKLELRDLSSAGQTTSEKNGDMDSVYNEWSPGVCVEGEIAVDEGDHENDAVCEEVHAGGIVQRLSALDARAAAWEGAERAKFHAKYKREEARINAWETLQKAKAEAELKKLEVKLERLRSKATEKVLSKVAAAERRAEEMRAAAEAQQAEQMRKVRERASNLRKTALFPGSFAVCFARNYIP